MAKEFPMTKLEVFGVRRLLEDRFDVDVRWSTGGGNILDVHFDGIVVAWVGVETSKAYLVPSEISKSEFPLSNLHALFEEYDLTVDLGARG